MAENVNPHDEDSSPRWALDPLALGAELEAATRAAGLSGVDAAKRLGHKDSNQVSRWWNGKVGLSDQLVYFVSVAQESDEARRRLWLFMGGKAEDFDSILDDPELGPIVAALKDVHRRRDWERIRAVIVEQLRWLGAWPDEDRDQRPAPAGGARAGS